MLIDRQMDEQIVVYLCDSILLSNKNQLVHKRPHNVGLHLYQRSQIDKFIEKTSRSLFFRVWTDGEMGNACSWV